MDYSKLRAAALRDGEDEEAVTVDTRALIDKVLARYSGEWTTLRELIQNAADAQATTVTVKWETIPSTHVPLPNTTSRSEILKHTIANHTLRRLVVQNDGQPFTKTDWGRLKRIAEGNPDETKIGAFGVGFYSVFADCEEPFVSSGAEAMAFYWKGNALFTKKSVLPEEQATGHTTFVLDHRNATTPVPNILSVSQFLATSLTFVALQGIEFWIDDHQILSLKKKSSPSNELTLPRDLEVKTKENLMKVTSVDRTSTQIDASFMNVIAWKPQAAPSASKVTEPYGATEAPSLRSFFAKLTSGSSQSSSKARQQQKEQDAFQDYVSQDVTSRRTSTIFLRATSASLRTNVSAPFAAELERATKKPPPKTTKISILTSSYDETNASTDSASSGAQNPPVDVFDSVLPSKRPGGRIFIGFPTMQTTGAGLHMSAPSIIPTVEREAIDLNARWVRTWNVELLRAAGIVTRLAFANEMHDLSTKIERFVNKGEKIPAATISKLLPEAVHILKTFTFTDSTPSGQVGQLIEEAFWTCFKKASIEMFSSQGVLQTSEVRLGSFELGKFVDRIPVVPGDLKDLPFVRKLIDFGLISAITVSDIKKELENKPLGEKQLTDFISWAAKQSLTGGLDPPSRNALLEVAVATVGEGSDHGRIIALSDITHYHNVGKISASLPIPRYTIPLQFTVHSTEKALQALGWQPLELVPWLRFVFEMSRSASASQNITTSPQFAVQVLTTLSKGWDNMSNSSQSTIVSLLQANTVMPTKLGMRKPTESFFPSVKLFDDLPVIQDCDKLKNKFLVAIGVRKTIDLETIFTRLLSTSGDEKGQKKWSHVELIKYLASVQNDIPADDLRKLKESRICPAEAQDAGLDAKQSTDRMFKVSELFEPKDSLKSLGLPILQWPGQSLRPSSPEARFLALLGLRAFPSVPELVDMMAAKDEALRTKAMTYFIANHTTNRYSSFDLSESRKAIIPIQGSKQLVTPASCFVNDRAAILGFDIMRQDLHVHSNKFGVARDPPMVECVNRLLSRPPQRHDAAIPIFSYFTSRLRELGENNVAKLRHANIVPITRASKTDKSSNGVSYISPSRAYLGTSATYGDIFDFVDFGQDANAFLFTCGAKSEPTKLEVAQMACNEPGRLLSILQSPEKYLDLLKSLAEASTILHRDKELWRKMRLAPFLLAYKELAASKSKQSESDDDEYEAPIRQYQLVAAKQIVVVDDIISYRLFKDHLVCAPEEDALESFYLQLGAQRLSTIVQEDVRIGPRSQKHMRPDSLRKHVLERSKIFLYEYANLHRDGIKHDTKWLEKNFKVEMVRSVALRRTLRDSNKSHTEKRSAAGAQAGGVWTLFVADDAAPDMYQVGQAVCQMLLNRPNQQAYFFFEPFLTLDLYGLRARGYNVDRILRAKAAEARIAEEERQKLMEQERQRLLEEDRDRGNQNGQHPQAIEATARDAVTTPEKGPSIMPGSWDSPDEPRVDGRALAKRGRSLLSNLGRRFGFDTDEPFATSPNDNSPSAGGSQNGAAGPPAPQNDNGKVTSSSVVKQNLLKAIDASRPHGLDSVFSEPKVNEVKEQATYCDKKPAHNIRFIAEASNGTKVYVTNDLSSSSQSEFLAANIASINAFATLLRDVGGIYSLPADAIHIFYDESGGTIAFNTGGSIFCNFRFFSQLHASKMDGQHSTLGRAEAATWWWVVMAHELAHNIVSTHNSEHSYYTESFIQQYFGKMMTMLADWIQEGGNSSFTPAPVRRQLTSGTTASAVPPPPYTPNAQHD